jgi:hypothetical protein
MGLEDVMMIAIFVLSFFGPDLCCKALVLYLFSIAFVSDVLDSAVAALSSNVPFPMAVF